MSEVHIAVSGSNVYVVWSEEKAGQLDVMSRRSIDNGASWKTKVNVSNDAKPSNSPAIATSGSNVYVSWNQNVDTCCYDIYFRRSSDDGASWKSKINLSNSGTVEFKAMPVIAAFGSSVYVSYADFVENDSCIEPFISKSANSGASFAMPKKLGCYIDEKYDMELNVSRAHVYLTLSIFDTGSTCGFDNFVVFFRSIDGGTTFASKNIASGYIGSPQVVVSGSKVFIIYSEGEPDDCDPNLMMCFS